MQKISLIVLCFMLVSGCAHLRTMSAPDEENNNVSLPRLGINPTDTNGKIIVVALAKDGPAELAGIKAGDRIVSIDGNKLTQNKELQNHMNNKPIGENVIVIIDRNGTPLTFNIEPKILKVRPTQLKIDNLLEDKKKVSIVVLVSQVKNSLGNVPPDWAESVKANTQSDAENKLLTGYQKYDNFSIVDRSKINHILDEFKFSQMGYVSNKLSAKIGEMTGATHIIDITFSRFSSQTHSYEDIYNYRLIDIQSGQVLAVDRITMRY